jgi:hypothetical protein
LYLLRSRARKATTIGVGAQPLDSIDWTGT